MRDGNLGFESVRLNIGDPFPDAGQQWATLYLSLFNGDEENKASDGYHMPSVEIRILVSDNPDATLRELQEGARNAALAVLKAATATLSQSSIQELGAIEKNRQSAELAAIEHTWNNLTVA